MNQNIIFIGLIEEGNRRNLLRFTKEFFEIAGYNIIFRSMNNLIVYSNNKRTIILCDYVVEDLNVEESSCYNFDIVVYSSFTNNYLDTVIKLFKESKVCVYNLDAEGMIPLLASLENVIAINYGFNNKACLTISSYNIDEHIVANLCLQRDIVPFYGERIEPFEFALEINSCDEIIIYPVLAATILNIILGNSILNKKPYNIIRLNY